jgi:hypothetical protein
MNAHSHINIRYAYMYVGQKKQISSWGMHASTNRKHYKNILNNSCVDFCNLFAIVEETLHRIPVAKTLLVNRQDQNASAQETFHHV